MVRFVNESLTSLEFCLVLSHSDLQRAVTLTLTTVVGTASGNACSHCQCSRLT